MAKDILIVDDEADIRMLVSGILSDEGYECREAGNSDEALAAVQTRRPSLIILDIWLQKSAKDGLQILEEVKKDHPNVPVIIISGHGTIETAVAAIKKGAYDFIEKPFKADRLLLMVERAIETSRLIRENSELKVRAGMPVQFVGTSPVASHIRQTIEKISGTNSRVLISGAAGSGKELVARLIHSASPRASAPFVTLNCAMLSADKFEVELFGEAVGGKHKTGLLEQAHGGTLFLSEIGDLPLDTQSKMAKLLHDNSFQRTGSENKVEFDVRVIASSTRNLNEEIKAGKFRQELFYRLNVMPIEIPPLAGRREDIPVLSQYLMDVCSEISGAPKMEFGDDAMTVMKAYDWPGNVRQLRNVVEWLLIMNSGKEMRVVKADMLPPEVRYEAPSVLTMENGAEFIKMPLREAREAFERDYLLMQTMRFNGNISRTATFIGMERSALHRKLKSLGLQNAKEEEMEKTGG